MAIQYLAVLYIYVIYLSWTQLEWMNSCFSVILSDLSLHVKQCQLLGVNEKSYEYWECICYKFLTQLLKCDIHEQTFGLLSITIL